MTCKREIARDDEQVHPDPTVALLLLDQDKTRVVTADQLRIMEGVKAVDLGQAMEAAEAVTQINHNAHR